MNVIFHIETNLHSQKVLGITTRYHIIYIIYLEYDYDAIICGSVDYIYHWLLIHCIKVNFSCRHLAGFGLTDGEGTERLWSYMRPLAAMTKEMTPSHRTDMLNDALLHYAYRKLKGFGKLFKNVLSMFN